MIYNHPIYGAVSINDYLKKAQEELARRTAEEVVKETEEEDQVAEDCRDPDYYEGKDGTLAIDVIEEFELGFCLGNVVKYVLRAGKKDDNSEWDDLHKALWYLERYIDYLRESQ